MVETRSEPAAGDELQGLCTSASDALQRTDYILAERLLEAAEKVALGREDFDTLARLYFPLQEARRQRRQRAGEGRIELPTLATEAGSASAEALAANLVDSTSHGIFLIATGASTEVAERLRQAHRDRGDFAEIILGVALPFGERGVAYFAVPRPVSVEVAAVHLSSPEGWMARLPAHSVYVGASVMGGVATKVFAETYAGAMALFEQLHRPFVAQAEAMPLSRGQLEAFRVAMAVDPASELAHQHAAFAARELARR